MQSLIMAILVSALLLATQVNGDAPDDLALLLAASVRGDHTLDLKIKLKNATDRPLSISYPNGNPLFWVRIVNQDGVDLYQHAYSLAKKGKARVRPTGPELITLDLQPREAKDYSVVIDRVYLSEGQPSMLPEGRYRVSVDVSSVKFHPERTAVRGYNSSYEVSLHHSNVVEIVVGKSQ
jgi:hypothetical protein